MSSAAGLLPDIERRRLRALVKADTVTAAPLHADDYWLITPNGSEMTKDDYLGAIASGQLRYQVFEPVSEMAVLGPALVSRTARRPLLGRAPRSSSGIPPRCDQQAADLTHR